MTRQREHDELSPQDLAYHRGHKALEHEVLEFLYHPKAGFEIPDRLRQTVMAMVKSGKIYWTGIDDYFRENPRYDLVIFWKMRAGVREARDEV